MIELNPVLMLIFFIIALFYSSAGFGGGSSYLAVLALFGLDQEIIKSTALLCNIVVVSGGTYLFYQEGYLNLKKVWPLIILSIPLAYLGGSIALATQTFYQLLGITLLIASVFMLLPINKNKSQEFNNQNLLLNGGIGGGIGFLSGLVGIGGGIFLSPLLHLSRWDKAKVIAATSSLFILVNSLAGLLGQVSNPAFSIQWRFILPLLLAVFLGGQIGSRLSSTRLNSQRIRQVTALLILVVALRILVN